MADTDLRPVLIRLASELPRGDDTRRWLLARLKAGRTGIPSDPAERRRLLGLLRLAGDDPVTQIVQQQPAPPATQVAPTQVVVQMAPPGAGGETPPLPTVVQQPAMTNPAPQESATVPAPAPAPVPVAPPSPAAPPIPAPDGVPQTTEWGGVGGGGPRGVPPTPIPVQTRAAFDNVLLPEMVRMVGTYPVEQIRQTYLRLVEDAMRSKDDYYAALKYYQTLNATDEEFFDGLKRVIREWDT